MFSQLGGDWTALRHIYTHAERLAAVTAGMDARIAAARAEVERLEARRKRMAELTAEDLYHEFRKLYRKRH